MNWAEYSESEEEKAEIPKEHSLERPIRHEYYQPPQQHQSRRKLNKGPRRPKQFGEPSVIISRVRVRET